MATSIRRPPEKETSFRPSHILLYGLARAFPILYPPADEQRSRHSGRSATVALADRFGCARAAGTVRDFPGRLHRAGAAPHHRGAGIGKGRAADCRRRRGSGAHRDHPSGAGHHEGREGRRLAPPLRPLRRSPRSSRSDDRCSSTRTVARSRSPFPSSAARSTREGTSTSSSAPWA